MTQVEVILEDVPDTFDTPVEAIVILEDADENKYYVNEDDEVVPLPEVPSDPEDVRFCCSMMKSKPRAMSLS